MDDCPAPVQLLSQSLGQLLMVCWQLTQMLMMEHAVWLTGCPMTMSGLVSSLTPHEVMQVSHDSGWMTAKGSDHSVQLLAQLLDHWLRMTNHQQLTQ